MPHECPEETSVPGAATWILGTSNLTVCIAITCLLVVSVQLEAKQLSENVRWIVFVGSINPFDHRER